MLQELIESLFNWFRQLVTAPNPRARRPPEPEEDYSQVQPQPQDHTHAGTIEISRSDSPPNLRSYILAAYPLKLLGSKWSW